MTDFDGGQFNLSSMSDEEKDALIKQLASAYNKHIATIASLYNAQVVFEGELWAGDVLGQRSKTLRSVAYRMHMVSGLTIATMDWDPEQMNVDAEFSNIVSDLDLDEEAKDE